jgi:CDP-diacylglycerol--glycerol-3-phosphate 3-phosphatidyltransferase
MIPLFLALFYVTAIGGHYLWALAVFVTAALTDTLDGRIARKRGLVTDFGALMDPLADKLLIMAAMVAFAHVGIVHGAVVIVILAREFLVTSIRLVAAGKGQVIAADRWGKLKTVFQMLWVTLGLIMLGVADSFLGGVALPEEWGRVFAALTWIVTVLTGASGANYVVKNRKLFADA